MVAQAEIKAIKGGSSCPHIHRLKPILSMTSLVRNNRTGELYRRGIIVSRAVLCRIMLAKAGYYFSFPLSASRAEDVKRENVEET